MERNINIEKRKSIQASKVQEAIINKNIVLDDYLNNYDFDINEINLKAIFESTPSSEIVEKLIKKGIINAIDQDGNTALHYAVKEGDLTIVKLLIENGANIHLKNNEGETALHIAHHRYNFANFGVIIGLAIKTNVAKKTPDCYIDIMKLLIENGEKNLYVLIKGLHDENNYHQLSEKFFSQYPHLIDKNEPIYIQEPNNSKKFMKLELSMTKKISDIIIKRDIKDRAKSTFSTLFTLRHIEDNQITNNPIKMLPRELVAIIAKETVIISSDPDDKAIAEQAANAFASKVLGTINSSGVKKQ